MATSSPEKSTLVLSTLSGIQTLLITAFIVFISAKFDVEPSDVKSEVLAAKSEIIAAIAKVADELETERSRSTAREVWIEKATQSLLDISEELKLRGQWMENQNTKWDELEKATRDRYTGTDHNVFLDDLLKKNPSLKDPRKKDP